MNTKTLFILQLARWVIPLFLLIPGINLASQSVPINLLPMYGHPEIKKTERQKKLDTEFIQTVTKNSGSREKASIEFAMAGWHFRGKQDYATSMKRFNQAWLLNPDYYMPHWGFGALLLGQGKPAQAIKHYEKALSLLNDPTQKHRLLTDTARSYSIHGSRQTDKAKSIALYDKANRRFNEAITLDPKYASAYHAWSFSLYDQGDYKKSWQMVKKARQLGMRFNQEFITALSKKMEEP